MVRIKAKPMSLTMRLHYKFPTGSPHRLLWRRNQSGTKVLQGQVPWTFTPVDDYFKSHALTSPVVCKREAEVLPPSPQRVVVAYKPRLPNVIVQQFRQFKKTTTVVVPNMEFQNLVMHMLKEQFQNTDTSLIHDEDVGASDDMHQLPNDDIAREDYLLSLFNDSVMCPMAYRPRLLNSLGRLLMLQERMGL